MSRFYTVVAVVLVCLIGCGGSEPKPSFELAAIDFETQDVPPADAGRLYNTVIVFTATGGAAPPDQFEVSAGALPPGVEMTRDRVDLDGDGLPDEGGAFTGNARLLGIAREAGSYAFTIRAISTGALAQAGGELPALATEQAFTVNVGEGTIAILNADGGTSPDPAVPSFPSLIPFVNPANPQAFFGFSFLTAGGTGNNKMSIFLPRELALSVFDAVIANNPTPGPDDLRHDTDESITGGATSPFENDFSDGGWFVLQAGTGKIQVGGFQSPRGAVRVDTNNDGVADADFMLSLRDRWFQSDVCPTNSRRDFGDTMNLSAGDATLGGQAPIIFCDYFDATYKDTDGSEPDASRAKYPFNKDQYVNAFYNPFMPGDLTPLKFNFIVQAVDTRGTPDKTDDIIARRNYSASIQIPDIVIDTVLLPAGQAGIDYNVTLGASGGVPPLDMELELVDGTGDGEPDAGDPLTKDLFGVDLDSATTQFIGVPRASSDVNGAVDLTVRVWAAVMNPSQGGAAKVPTGTAGEYDGTLFPGGEPGRHKTFPVYFAPPTDPQIGNDSLQPGVDGVSYASERIFGAGGVPLLAPYPVGFNGTYPTATAQRAYEFDASYIRDLSYGTDAGTVDPDNQLPLALAFEGSPSVATNGEITGTAFDRGFHEVTFTGLDFYVGDGSAPDPDIYRRSFMKTLALGISPDSAVYLKGVPTSEGGTKPSGLLDNAMMSVSRMVPLFTASGVYNAETGNSPVRNTQLPRNIDFLPVLLANGGSDAHVDKSIPSINGIWPAESDKNDRWEYYYYGNVNPYMGWKHLQQEHTWIQTPTPDQLRVFLWAESKIKKYANSIRYQVLNTGSTQRGVMVFNPNTGRYWVPAILTNNNAEHGKTFGTEDIFASSAYCINNSSYSNSYAFNYGYIYGGSYNRYYTYAGYCQGDREARLGGGGTYIDAYTRSSNGVSSAGRTSTSVAVSADGLWGATALPGGNGPKILLWRNDGLPIPAAILAQGHVTAMDGVDDTGATITDSSCIIDVSTYGADQRYLLPDSLMFVKDGLLFLMEKRLDQVHGVSLVDGHLSAKSVNARTALSAAQGTGPSASSTRGQPIPDQDWVLGQKRVGPSSCQFSFKGNKPAAGEEGPDKVAFIAGALYNIDPMADSYAASAYYRLSSDAVRKGYGQGITGNKSVLFLEMDTSGGLGLDLGNGGTVIKDLSGDTNSIYGDFLTPGRLGEELDFLDVSADGKYVAAVRNVGTGVYSYIYYSINPTFATISTSTTTTTSYYQSSDDILLFSTDNTDLDTANGDQTVLYLGTGKMGTGTTLPVVDYASKRNWVNANGRRICGVQFSADSKSLIFVYQGHDRYHPKYFGSAYQYTINASSRSSTYAASAARISIRFNFRTSGDGAINFAASSNLSNMLTGVSGIGGVGDTSAPFTNPGGEQQFWATFKSPNGNYLYYISDATSSRNHMVGFNITAGTIDGHDSFDPFSTHPSTIGFEQFDCNAWNYEGRFTALPGGPVSAQTGKSADGIVFVIASDASAGATNATDLEVYAFDSNIGGDLVVLTSDVTDGSANAINHLYISVDANVLIGQRTKSAADSGASRAVLNGNNDLFVVTNVHDVLDGAAAPNAFHLSEGKSHGSTAAFVGEGSPAGVQAVIFSAAASGTNTSWDKRKLYSAALTPGAVPSELDPQLSYYVTLAGTRVIDDDPTTSD